MALTPPTTRGACGAHQLEYLFISPVQSSFEASYRVSLAMSEVPEAGKGPNPFSFKNFVKRTSTTEQSSTGALRGQRSARSAGRKGEEKKDPAIIKKKKKKPGGGESEELPFPDIGVKADAGKLHSYHKLCSQALFSLHTRPWKLCIK